MTSVQFTVDIPAIWQLTLNQRLHWRKKAVQTAAIRNSAAWYTRQAKLPHLPAADCTVTIYFPTRRSRDVHNWMVTAKAAIDGVVDAGLLKGDSKKYLTGPDLREGATLSDAGRLWLTFQFTERKPA